MIHTTHPIIKNKAGLLTLAEELGNVSSGVHSIWLRNNLENFKKRLQALEEKAANDGFILTETQVAALEKKKHDDEA